MAPVERNDRRATIVIAAKGQFGASKRNWRRAPTSQLPPGQKSTAITHRTVEEIWFSLSDRGEMWRKRGEQELSAIFSGAFAARTGPILEW
jgi:mannose-6-phosphate isomerase-like protein (cupin superfamily)